MKLVLRPEHINQEDGTIKEQYLADIIGKDGKTLEARIDILDLRNCSWLKPTPALLNQLCELENKPLPLGEFELTWPRHFGRNEEITKVKERLNDIAEAYRTSHTTGAPNFVHLMNLYIDGVTRYFNDDSLRVVADLNRVLDVVQKNPACLEWLDPIAAIYTEGCINQPVAGFFRIASWLAIEDKVSVADKINASRQLMIMDNIINLVETKFTDVDEAFKAEACNMLIRYVASELFEQGIIKEEWIGVQRNIHNQEIIGGLDEKMFKDALSLAKNIMDPKFKQLKLTQFICGTMEVGSDEMQKIEIWGKMVFPQEVQKIEDKYAGIKVRLQELSANNDPIPDDLLSQFKEAADVTKPKSRFSVLKDLNASLDMTKQKEIVSSVTSLTMSRLSDDKSPSTSCCTSIYNMLSGVVGKTAPDM